mgnify:CR=1 FL=1
MSNNKLIEMLKIHEGVETHAYKCSASKITIGVGRNIDPEGGIGLSEDEIDVSAQYKFVIRLSPRQILLEPEVILPEGEFERPA